MKLPFKFGAASLHLVIKAQNFKQMLNENSKLLVLYSFWMAQKANRWKYSDNTKGT